jgi:glycosyltransferase involved in cell wall biosynthesis
MFNKLNTEDKNILTVIVLTYNQQNTIIQTLQSIVEQKTFFFFEILIGDDNSSDFTRTEIETFISNNISENFSIELIHNKQNLGLINNYKNLIYKASGKYISAIAGDDYWINNEKLQLQVDYLETFVEFGMVHTNYNILHVNDNSVENIFFKREEGQIFEKLLIANQVGALTAMFRHSLAIEAFESNIYNPIFLMEDYPLWLFIANKTKIGYIDKITATWRKLPESASNSLSLSKNIIFDNSVLMVQSFFLGYSQKYNEILEMLISKHQRHLMLANIHQINIVADNSYFFLKKHKALKFSDKKNYLGVKFPNVFKFLRIFKKAINYSIVLTHIQLIIFISNLFKAINEQ